MRTTLVSLFQREKMRILCVFHAVINLLLHGIQSSPGKCHGLCHGAHYLHGDLWFSWQTLKEDKINLVKMLSNDCMCAAARRAVVVEPRVGIIGSRVCIHVWFMFFFLIYNFFTSCARSLLCPHLTAVHPAAFPGLFRSRAEHDLLLTLASTAWEVLLSFLQP